jgi:hypothetical protein
MKKFYLLILLFIGFALIALKTHNSNSKTDKISINKEEVDSIKIANYCSPMDSCRFFVYKLDDRIVDDLIGKLNEAKLTYSAGFFQEYTLFIFFDDGTEKLFAINGSLIIDNTTKNCFHIQEENYFEKLWIHEYKKTDYYHTIRS